VLEAALDVHLIDGTYELFRHYYALPSARVKDGREVAAVRGVLASVLGMIKGGATHVAVATDHVIESFRNGLWPGYKTGAGIEPDLWAQFSLLEDALSKAGIVVWPMVEFEADDALAAGAVAAARDARVERVIICTPDKDLAQCVRGTRIVQLNRRTRVTRDEAGVVQKFERRQLECLANTLSIERERALLFRTLATLRTDIELFDDVDDLRWDGPTPDFDALAARFDAAVTEPKRPAIRRSR
jgi:5'-3' exonuclease